MNKELKQFDIDIEDIKPTDDFSKYLYEAIEKMKEYTLKDRFEIVLNENLINCKEKLTNFRTILGCRISYEYLDKNVSFIVREDKKPSYEQLEERIDKAINYIDQVIMYKQVAKEIDKELNELLGILILGDNNE